MPPGKWEDEAKDKWATGNGRKHSGRRGNKSAPQIDAWLTGRAKEPAANTTVSGNLPCSGPANTGLGSRQRKARMAAPATTSTRKKLPRTCKNSTKKGREGQLSVASPASAAGVPLAIESATTGPAIGSTSTLTKLPRASKSSNHNAKEGKRSVVSRGAGAGVPLATGPPTTAGLEMTRPSLMKLPPKLRHKLQTAAQNEGVEANDLVAGRPGSADGTSASDAVPPSSHMEVSTAATSQKEHGERPGAPREGIRLEWWGNAANGSTPEGQPQKWYDDLDPPSVLSSMRIGPANLLPGRNLLGDGGAQQGGVEETKGEEAAQQGNVPGGPVPPGAFLLEDLRVGGSDVPPTGAQIVRVGEHDCRDMFFREVVKLLKARSSAGAKIYFDEPSRT